MLGQKPIQISMVIHYQLVKGRTRHKKTPIISDRGSLWVVTQLRLYVAALYTRNDGHSRILTNGVCPYVRPKGVIELIQIPSYNLLHG
jgi:hypothetical protein